MGFALISLKLSSFAQQQKVSRRLLFLSQTIFALGDALSLVACEKTDPRSADYPLTPTPRTTLWTTSRTTLRTTPTDHPKLSTKLLLRRRKTQEAYLLHLHNHNCTKNSRHFGRWPVKNGAKTKKTGSRKSVKKKGGAVFHEVIIV